MKLVNALESKLVLVVFVFAVVISPEPLKADFIFGIPTNLGPTVNSSVPDFTPRMPADGLSLYFSSSRGGGSGGNDIWVMTRQTKSDQWSTPANLGLNVNSSAADYSLSISADDRTLYFVSNRAGGSGGYDIWVTERPTTNDPWGTPVNLGPTVNSSADEYAVGISGDNRTLYFTSNRAGGSGSQDLWFTMRPTTSDQWGAPVNLGPTVNSSSNEWTLGVSADERAIYIASDRSGGYGSLDLWVTRRATTNSDWGQPMNLGPMINTSSVEGFPIVSADGRTLYFSSNRAGGSGGIDLWQASITTIVDINGDGIVDSADMSALVNYWGTDESLCDIDPMPWGDSIVDVQDLIVLSEYLFKDINDPTLAAHWALDETEGIFVADSVGNNNGYAIGEPIWLPNGGIVNGALQLDGIDDYIVMTGTIPNLTDGPFSIIAWVKGGAPGQVVISQAGDGTNWLLTDPAEGNLMTELKSSGRSGRSMVSQANITDGNWHRIAFVWDGSYRTLYVDSIAIAQDIQNDLESLSNGLHIGTGNTMTPGTYWSGLIDDVRIYKRVVIP